MKNTSKTLFLGFGGMFILQFIFWSQFILIFAFDIPLYIDGFNGIISFFFAFLPPALYCLSEKNILLSLEDTKEKRSHFGILWITLSCTGTVCAASLNRYKTYFDRVRY